MKMMNTPMDADDIPGKTEAGEGTPAEEAADKKLPKRGQRTAMHMATKPMGPAKRAPRVNRASVI